jgi:hypothetical protein
VLEDLTAVLLGVDDDGAGVVELDPPVDALEAPGAEDGGVVALEPPPAPDPDVELEQPTSASTPATTPIASSPHRRTITPSLDPAAQLRLAASDASLVAADHPSAARSTAE